MPAWWSLPSGAASFAPNEFICPISLEVMGCPVIVTQSGISYERSQLTRWLQTAPYTEPKTNMRHSEPIAFSDNVALRQAIRDWHDAVVETDDGAQTQASASPAAEPVDNLAC